MKKNAIFSEGGIARASYDLSVVIVDLGSHIEIERALRSCLAQTLAGQSMQVLLISKEENSFTASVIKNYGDLVELYTLEEEQTDYELTEYVMQHVRGRHFLWLDALDYMSDYMLLSQQIYLYDHPSMDGTYVDYWLAEVGSDRKLKRLDGLPPSTISGVMWRKDAFMAKLHNVSSESHNHNDLHKVFLESSKLGHLPIAFFRYTKR